MTVPHIKALQDVQALEERLQLMKWVVPVRILRLRPASARSAQIVSRTAGLLGKRFPAGLRYERQLRHTWAKRFQRLGL